MTTKGRTYGSLWLDGDRWFMLVDPHVAMWAKRIFRRLPTSKTGGAFELSDNPSTCVDLIWLMQRFPLKVDDREYLDRQAKRHVDKIATLDQIVDPNYTPRRFELAIPARDYQNRAAELWLARKGLLVADDVGLGKQQPIDTKVLTPMGYREIGSLVIGDEVIGSDGKPCRVTGVFPQGVKPSYRMKLTDGSSVESGPEHLWAVEYWRGGDYLHRIIVTTDDLRNGAKINSVSKAGQNNILDLSKTTMYVPLISAPVELQPIGALPIDPYLMGQLISQGSLSRSSMRITIGVPDQPHILEQITGRCDIGSVRTYKNATHVSILGIGKQIRGLGLNVLSGQKFIPDLYATADVPYRIRLLHGLMDGDGSISKDRSRVTYSTMSRRLASDVRSLVELLGGISSVREYDRTKDDKGIEFRVRVRLPPLIKPFSLPRKLERYSIRERFQPRRTVVSVEYVRDVESVCIAVDSKDHLYATEHAILTHNTISALAGLTDPATLPALVVCLAHLPRQWAQEVAKFAPTLTTHTLRTVAPYELPKVDGRGPDVIISSYHKLDGWQDVLPKYIRSVVYDECQELRRSDSNKYRAAKAIAARTPYRLGCSATPIFNFGGEIFNVMEILSPGCLGTRSEFLTEWCTHTAGDDKARLKDPAAFGSWLREQHLMLRRTRRDVGRELPPLSRVTHTIDCDESVLKSIEGKAGELARLILTEVHQPRGTAMHAAEEFSNLLRQMTGISKAPYVAEFVKLLLENGEPVVLFGWHRAVYEIWLEKLKNHLPALYTGSESGTAKQNSVDKFLEGGTDCLIMSLRSGAGVEGLQKRCRTVVIGELDWSPGAIEQCIGRIFRDGQPDPVTAYFLLSDSGADPMMAETLGLKRDQIEGIVGREAGELVQRNDGSAIKRLAEQYLAKIRKEH